MLNQSKVLKYIKSNLSFPFMALEITDQDIIDYFIENTLVEFSRFFPYVTRTSLNLALASNLVPGTQNQFYFYDSEDLEIMNIIDVIMPNSEGVILGHPYMGVMSYEELPGFELGVMKSRSAEQKSMWNYNFTFHDPNIVEIRPVPSTGTAIIEYETIQPTDLRGISMDISHFFKELAFADILIYLGRVRRRYSDLKTPFGSIEVNGSELFQEGKDLRREIIETLSKNNRPNISIDFG
jgi:hypothetical protein